MALVDEIQKMIMSALESMEVTSANPTHINTLIQVNNIDLPDLDQFLKKDTDNKLQDKITNKDADGNFTEKIDTKSLMSDKDKLISSLKEQDVKKILGVGGLDSNTLKSIATSGKGGVLGFGSGLAGGVGGAGKIAAIFPPAMIALLVAQLTIQIVKQLREPGGLLDRRVRIVAREEAFAELDRQTRQNTRIGDRQIIIQQVAGWRSNNGNLSTNTSKIITENSNRVLDIDLFDKTLGKWQ